MTQEEQFYVLLNKTQKIAKYSFENNWPYILQATRNGLMTLGDSSNLVYYTKRYVDEEKSPIVVVNSLGKFRKEFVKELAINNYKKKVQTIVKNVSMEDLGWYINHNFFEKTTPWSFFSLRDDNTFPQYVVTRATVINRDFKDDIRYQIRRFSKRPITLQEYSSSYDKDAMKLLNNFSVYSENKGNDYSIEVKRGHMFFFDNNIKQCIRFAHIENNNLIGFSFLTPVNETVFYNAVICKYERNIMKYLVYQCLKYLAERNIDYKYFCMQGSENKGQDYLKSRLCPTIVIKKLISIMILI